MRAEQKQTETESKNSVVKLEDYFHVKSEPLLTGVKTTFIFNAIFMIDWYGYSNPSTMFWDYSNPTFSSTWTAVSLLSIPCTLLFAFGTSKILGNNTRAHMKGALWAIIPFIFVGGFLIFGWAVQGLLEGGA